MISDFEPTGKRAFRPPPFLTAGPLLAQNRPHDAVKHIIKLARKGLRVILDLLRSHSPSYVDNCLFRDRIGPAREGPSAEVVADAQNKPGEEAEVDPEQYQDPDNEVGLFAGTTYEQDDEDISKTSNFLLLLMF
ncbi:hypothetical protein FIBSPDRAFT_954951 [Athelia psychrophila]|uniref:Uncharacterized protein n=1 Tax=Athelia psychrophila TaxID=1759441 RepID=A0A166IJ77_9AGAM|nr:hypothetical protein FIBSPDRAFT_954951 [Fibularhizoctonia sp. CBS 109695]